MAKKKSNTGSVLLVFGLIAFAGIGGLSATRGVIDSIRGSGTEESTDTDPITNEQEGSNQTENDTLPSMTSKDPGAGGNPSTSFFFGDSSFSNPGFPSAARNQTPFGDPSDPLGAFRGLTFDRTLGRNEQLAPSEGFSPFRANVLSFGRGANRTITPNGPNTRPANTRPVGAVNSSNSRSGSVTQDIIENLRAGRPIRTATPSGRGGRINQATPPPPPGPPRQDGARGTQSNPATRSGPNLSFLTPGTSFGGGSATVTRNRPGVNPTHSSSPQGPQRPSEERDRRLSTSTTTTRRGRATQNARFNRF